MAPPRVSYFEIESHYSEIKIKIVSESQKSDIEDDVFLCKSNHKEKGANSRFEGFTYRYSFGGDEQWCTANSVVFQARLNFAEHELL